MKSTGDTRENAQDTKLIILLQPTTVRQQWGADKREEEGTNKGLDSLHTWPDTGALRSQAGPPSLSSGGYKRIRAGRRTFSAFTCLIGLATSPQPGDETK